MLVHLGTPDKPIKCTISAPQNAGYAPFWRCRPEFSVDCWERHGGSPGDPQAAILRQHGSWAPEAAAPLARGGAPSQSARCSLVHVFGSGWLRVPETSPGGLGPLSPEVPFSLQNTRTQRGRILLRPGVANHGECDRMCGFA